MLFNDEVTEAVTGISLDDATTMAMDALSTDVVADEISEQLLDRRFRLTGSVFGTYFLVDKAEEIDAVSARLDAIAPALTQRQPATRLFAASSPVYAGQYQPEAMVALRTAETSTYVAIVGKIRTCESGDRVNVAIGPESITEVDESIREAWVTEAAAQTSGRIGAFEPGEAPFGTQTLDEYGESLSDIREAVVAVEDGNSHDREI